ncbi:uncharacterized protein EI90DRAFT_794469 [Cantharellus anzutake]|uniref:uncharacterized protein n=1 Tax=Cantharellus anzutake TaxID=1750568 RepID=UPI0019081429|nr:uncharacterized protein EI90DRAFT_794469 [Cantharellus anzutake]KAF8342839.1 hypothetical protein EI90DRAFT_794469 [Cantharellus anzutake]
MSSPSPTTSSENPAQQSRPVPVSWLILKLMSALPALCQWAQVPVTDLSSIDQWKACGGSCLLLNGLAQRGGTKKEVYNVVAIWLRNIATRHQEDVQIITVLVQKWLYTYGRWPITIALFVTSAPSASKPLLPSGQQPEGDDVPNGLRGDVYKAAMDFKQFLADDASDHTTLPMVPVFWEDVFALRMSLTRILTTRPPISPNLLDAASSALETPARPDPHHSDPSVEQTSEALKGLQLDSSKEPVSSPASSRSATPKGNDVSSGNEASSEEDSSPEGATK